MELRQLRYAVAVAGQRSFTRAAKGEHVVQSALSHQVQKLEEELGVRLFDRTTRSVAMTSAGETLLPTIRQAISGIDEVSAQAQAIRGVLQGRIAVGMMEVPPDGLEVAKLMATFHRRYPGISVSVRSGDAEHLIRSVRDRELDAAFIGAAPPARDTMLTSIPLMSETLVAVIPEMHELAGRSPINLSDLARFSFIDFPRGYGLRTETDRSFLGLPRTVGFEVTRVELVIQFVRHELGIALLPESVARMHHRRGGLVLAKVCDADLTREVRLLHPAAPALTAVGRAFIATVRDAVSSV